MKNYRTRIWRKLMSNGMSEHLGPLSSGVICPFQRTGPRGPVALGAASRVEGRDETQGIFGR